MTLEKLSSVVQLIKSGNRRAALPLLKEIIQANPKDENAWLWLYACVDKAEEKKYCLQKALEINPGNQHARNALEKLTEPTSQPVRQAAPVQVTPAPPASKNKSVANQNRRPRFFILGAVFLLLLCILVPFRA